MREFDKTDSQQRARKDTLWHILPTVLSLLVFALALGVTERLWKHTQEIAALEVQARFDSRVREITERIEHQMMSYELVLRGAQGWFATSGQVSRDKFSAYIDTLHLQANYPGMRSIGYSPAAPAAQSAAFTIYRELAREPDAPADRQDDPLCRAAMSHARDPDSVFISDKLLLEDSRAGFLMCAPVYRIGAKRHAERSRRASVAGWVTMRFGMGNLMFGILGDLYPETGIAIYDGEEISQQSLMYRTRATGTSGAQLSAFKHIDIAGHYWTMPVTQESAGMLGDLGKTRLVLYTGIATSLLLGLLSWSLLTGRAKAMNAAELLNLELAERKKAEHELRFAAAVYNTMDEAVAITDSDNRYVSVNPAFTEITGYAQDEVLAKNPRINSSGLHPSEFYREMRASLGSTGMWHGEISNRRKNGEIYVAWLSIKRVADEAGIAVHYIAVFSDISKRKAVENSLRESREALHSVIETAMDAVVLTDAYGVITDWNARAEEILGWTKEDACGRDLQNMIAPFRYLDGSPSSLRQFLLLRNGAAQHSLIETTAIHRDGREFPVELTVASIKVKGRRAFSCFVHDVSARHERDAALRAANLRAEAASRAKGDFLANMSHEIRTPMNSILGMAYLTLKTDLAPKQRDYLEKIHYSGQHLLGIINDILDFSKIEAGKLKIESIDLNLHKIIENVTNMLGGKAAEKGLALDFRIDADVPVHLRGDPLRLGQVLINYVSNAIKFTENGGITIRVSKASESAGNMLLRFEVQDSGIGINEEGVAHLFQLFQQADTSTTRKFGGTGLGLAISKQLSALMGGEVGVESEIGKGSIFWFTASLKKMLPTSPGNVAPGRQLTLEQDAQQAIRGAKILLVEDNPFNQLVATDLLERVGVAVSIANDGKEAIAILRRQDFDCVLMDMQMPEMDGLEATRHIRADPAIAGTLIIAMTANTRSEDRESCIEAGMDDLLTKPIAPDLLYATLASRLSNGARYPDETTGEATSHLTKAASGQVIGYSDSTKPANGQVAAYLSGSPTAGESEGASLREFHDRQFYKAAPAASHETRGDPEIIDLAVLSRMVGHDEDQVRKYAAKFLVSAQEGLDSLQTALKYTDMKELAALGHRIKSSARTVGAIGFSNLCQALEQPGLAAQQAEKIVADMVCLLALIERQIGELRDEQHIHS